MADTTALAELIEVIDVLRSPGGCPWDAEQTHESLAKYLVEETYEVVDAIASQDQAQLREELGDLLLQVVIHSRLAEEHPEHPFDIEQVAQGITAKMRRRHPHVFAGATARDAAEVQRNWQTIKRQEKQRRHPLDDIPPSMPALARAAKVYDRVGDDAVAPVSDDLGARLYDLVCEGRRAGLDAETSLRDHLRLLEAGMRDGA